MQTTPAGKPGQSILQRFKAFECAKNEEENNDILLPLPPKTFHSMKKARLLIAEDDKLLLKFLSSYFDKQGYEVIAVSEGREAISQIKENKFDLVITDLNMPFASGIEIISLVRNELKQDLPIIMLTSEGIENTELEAFKIGVSEFISKPFSPQVLEVRVEKILAQSKK